MKPDLVGAQCRRLVSYIEERIAVGGEHEIGARIVNSMIERFTGLDRSNEDPIFAVTSKIDRESNAAVVRAHCPGAELVLLRMNSRERADIEYDFLLRPRGILMAHDAWILRLLGEAVLIDITVVGCGDACIFLRLACLQFCCNLIYQRLDGFKSRVGIGVLHIEIRNDARIFAIAQPVIVVDAYTAERFERLRYNRRNRDGAYRCSNRVGRTESQSACERNRSRSREAKREKPSSRKPAHPRAASNRGRMRRLVGAVWAQAWVQLIPGVDRLPEVLPSPPMAYLPALPEPRAIATAKHAQVVDMPSPLARSRHQLMSRHLAEL